MSSHTRHLLASADITADEISSLLDCAASLKRQPVRLLEGRELALVFEKPSLRTRVSFQVAMRHLGGETIYLAPQEVGLGEREPIRDVARVLARYVDIVAVRTFGQDIIEEYARYSAIPVINALTNEEHPCQALADLLTIREKFGRDLQGVSLAFVGDGNNVSASLVLTAASLGMDVRFASPPGYGLPEAVLGEASVRAMAAGGSVKTTNDPGAAVRAAQVLYTDTWTSMGFEREAERRRIDFAAFQLNGALVAQAPAALIMHDLPAHRGEEITNEVFESENAIIFDQAENRTWAQAAVVAFLLGVSDRIAV